MIKKILAFSIICYIIYIICYSFNINKATQHLTENALNKSHCCCAWYVMRSLQAGGCPIGIFPAWSYKYVLPLYKFKKIDNNNYTPEKGDIIVIDNSKEHFWGHIAMYNGDQWISDFKQKSMFVYKKKYNYNIYRF